MVRKENIILINLTKLINIQENLEVQMSLLKVTKALLIRYLQPLLIQKNRTRINKNSLKSNNSHLK